MWEALLSPPAGDLLGILSLESTVSFALTDRIPGCLGEATEGVRAHSEGGLPRCPLILQGHCCYFNQGLRDTGCPPPARHTDNDRPPHPYRLRGPWDLPQKEELPSSPERLGILGLEAPQMHSAGPAQEGGGGWLLLSPNWQPRREVPACSQV